MASEGESEPAADEKVSGLIARILGQLSISAWLPGSVVAGTTVLIPPLRAQRQASLNVPAAIDLVLSDKPKALILALPVLILSTLVVQAFSFEAIRTLEGYGGRPGPSNLIRSTMIKWQCHRLERIHKKRLALSGEAFAQSRQRWVNVFGGHVADLLEADAVEVELTPEALQLISAEDQQRAVGLNWSTHCRPEQMYRIERLQLIEGDYPIPSRILPTMLGNVLRSTEDSLQDGKGDIEGFALRSREKASPRVRRQHDQFRTRLDLYCTLVFVNLSLAATWFISLAPLAPLPKWTGASTGAILFLIFAVVSYKAAVSSARGYVVSLRSMDRSLQLQQPQGS